MKMKIIHAGREYDVATQDGDINVQDVEEAAVAFEKVINKCETFKAELSNGDILIMGKQAIANCVILISKN